MISKDAMTLYRFIIDSLEGGVFSYDRLATWLRENTETIEDGIIPTRDVTIRT